MYLYAVRNLCKLSKHTCFLIYVILIDLCMVLILIILSLSAHLIEANFLGIF